MTEGGTPGPVDPTPTPPDGTGGQSGGATSGGTPPVDPNDPGPGGPGTDVDPTMPEAGPSNPCGVIMQVLGYKDPTFKPVGKDIAKEARSDFMKAMLSGEDLTKEEIKAAVDGLNDLLMVLGWVAKIERLALLWNALTLRASTQTPTVHKPLASSGEKKLVTLTANAAISEDMWQDKEGNFRSQNPIAKALHDCHTLLTGVETTDLGDVAKAMAGMKIRWDLSTGADKFVAVDHGVPGLSDPAYTEGPMSMTGDHSSTADLVLRVLPEDKHVPGIVPRVRTVTAKAMLVTWKDLDASTFYPLVKGLGSAEKKITEDIVNRLIEGLLAHRAAVQLQIEWCVPKRRLEIDILDDGSGVAQLFLGKDVLDVHGRSVTVFHGTLTEDNEGVFTGDILVSTRSWETASGPIAELAGKAGTTGWSGVQIFAGRGDLVEIEDPTTGVSQNPKLLLRLAPTSNQPAKLYPEGDAVDPTYLYTFPDPGTLYIPVTVPSIPHLGKLEFEVMCSPDEDGGGSLITHPAPVSASLPAGPEFTSGTSKVTITATWLPPVGAP